MIMKTKQSTTMVVLVMTMAFAGEWAQAAEAALGEPPNSDRTGWQVQVGWAHQWSRGFSVKGSALGISANGRQVLPDALDLVYSDNHALIPRDFDDGYVRPDLWTGDLGVPAERQGMTWNWGAESAAQYQYNGGDNPTLSYHIDRGEYVGETYSDRRVASDDDIPSTGIEVKAKRLLLSWAKDGGSSNNVPLAASLDLNLVVGLAWFPRGSSKTYQRAVDRDVYRVSEMYTYLDYYGTEVGGSWPALDVPYSGEYGSVGGSSAGPLIPEAPRSATQTATKVGTLRNSVEIESEIWRLRGEVGVELAMPITSRLSVYIDPQFVLELVDMSVERKQTYSYSRSGQSASIAQDNHKVGVYPGLLLTTGADYRLSRNWYAGASLGYEWMVDSPSVHVGSDRVDYDLDGGEVSLYIGRRY